jgi:hypothetical protein
MGPQAVTNKDEWKALRRHEITLPSGAQVEIEIPNMPVLIKAGRIPNRLIQTVIQFQSASRVTQEMLEEEADFTNLIVSLTVKSPELTPEDVPDVPYEDQSMIVEFAMRARDMDAVGHHLGGLETVESFRDVRGL